MQTELDPPLMGSEAVTRAFETVRPAIEEALRSGLTNRGFLNVVVAMLPDFSAAPSEGSFEDSCLLVTAIGDTQGMEPRFRRMALSKAEQTVRTGRPTAERAPHQLRPGDTTSWGSVVLDGIVVACCGVQSHYDEMFSMWIAAAIKAEAKRVFAEHYADRRFV